MTRLLLCIFLAAGGTAFVAPAWHNPAAAATPSVQRSASPSELFGTAEIRADGRIDLPRWEQALERLERERPAHAACLEDAAACPNPVAQRWARLVAASASDGELATLVKVNAFVNARRYRDDAENYGRSDYWATPWQLFERGGDCEDGALAKYVSLRLAGFAPERMRLVVLQDTARDIAHAVLAVQTGGRTLILDNVNDELRDHTELRHYAPYYSVNERGRWAHVPSSRIVLPAAAE